MARWSASLSSSVSKGEGGQAGDPMNCSGLKVKYLEKKLWVLAPTGALIVIVCFCISSSSCGHFLRF